MRDYTPKPPTLQELAEQLDPLGPEELAIPAETVRSKLQQTTDTLRTVSDLAAELAQVHKADLALSIELLNISAKANKARLITAGLLRHLDRWLPETPEEDKT